MLRLEVRSIGRANASWQRDALTLYRQRIERFVSFSEHTIDTPKRRSNLPLSTLVQQEGARLLKGVPQQAYVVALDACGQSFTTEAFSRHIQQQQQHFSHMVFLIGGPDGHDKATRERAQLALALSEFTLPHIFAKILFYEQLYRVLSLMHNQPYHRA